MEVGEVHLRSPLVLHCDHRDALARARRDAANAGERRDDLFERLRYEALEVLGGDVLVRGYDGEPRVDDGGEEVDGETFVAQNAQQDQREEEHADGDGAMDDEPDHSSLLASVT